MPTFTIISAQEMERLIPLGQRMTGLTAKKMNKMDILELMGFLPKEILLQILLGEDWWKPTHVPTELKIGGFKWDRTNWGAQDFTERNIKASIQIALPFRDEGIVGRISVFQQGGWVMRDNAIYSKVEKFTKKRVVLAGWHPQHAKSTLTTTPKNASMFLTNPHHSGREKFSGNSGFSCDGSFTFEKMTARGYNPKKNQAIMRDYQERLMRRQQENLKKNEAWADGKRLEHKNNLKEIEKSLKKCDMKEIKKMFGDFKL